MAVVSGAQSSASRFWKKAIVAGGSLLPILISSVWCYLSLYVTVFPLCTIGRFLRRGRAYGFFLFRLYEPFAALCCCCWVAFRLDQLRRYWVVAWRARALRNRMQQNHNRRTRTVWKAKIPTALRRGTLGLAGLVLGVLFLIVTGFPLWWRVPGKAALQRHAWKTEVCTGWDYNIILSGVSFFDILSNSSVVSMATIVGEASQLYTLRLTHPESYVSRVTLDFSNYTIDYNYSAYRFLSATQNGNFSINPLRFPGLSCTYPDIQWNHGCAPPTISLQNETAEILRTSVSNYDNCTQLKACGRGRIEELAIPLGAVLIEMEKASLCCTSFGWYVLSITIKSLT
jgi:hypothetical protein